MVIALMVSIVAAGDGSASPVVRIDRDNIAISESCTLQFAVSPLIDADGNGVVHLTGNDITVDCADPALCGATAEDAPDTFKGIGIRITGKNVTLRNCNVTGYRIGIIAEHADGLTIQHCDVSGNFQQRLKSTSQAEDDSDWLWPHANDEHEWRTNYGAGICIQDSSNVTVRDVRARHGQNGIMLEHVEDSRIFDNDCSFLSGWGLAMWRSSRNVIDHNAFDFCIRGYSHGVYNRGQDSAGILLFEQCSENTFVENSVTHGGDGLFAFAGKEAIGELNPREDHEWYTRRGCNGNLFLRNDFSYAAAHGLELTFSFANRIIGNRFIANGICGIWGGYSQDTDILDNDFEANGSMAYGLERGGINIEHGRSNRIRHNRFTKNACGIHLWWDDDAALMKSPWGQANDPTSTDNTITNNRLVGDEIGVQLRQTGATVLDYSQFEQIEDASRVVADDASRKTITRVKDGYTALAESPAVKTFGSTHPVGARKGLEGRDKIVITEWGPYDWETPLLQCTGHEIGADTWRVLGKDVRLNERAVSVDGELDAQVSGNTIRIVGAQPGTVSAYKLRVDIGRSRLLGSGVVVNAVWSGKTFASTVDPREHAEEWSTRGMADGVAFETGSLHLVFGNNGPSQLKMNAAVDAAALPRDNFGTIAWTRLTFPAGRWRLRTVSDDGIRVLVDGKLVIDDWSHHSPTPHDAEITIDEDRTVAIRVEHFELDGYATLSLDIEPVNP